MQFGIVYYSLDEPQAVGGEAFKKLGRYFLLLASVFLAPDSLRLYQNILTGGNFMIKTVTLTGSELKVDGLGGFNTFVQNLSSGAMYASKNPGVAAGGDNVAEIPAGGGKLISTTNGTVYLLGTGKAELTGLDTDGVIATGGTAVYGGGGESGASAASLMAYADASDEATLIAAKNYADAVAQGKADRTELPTTLPANGGNAATVNGHTVGADVPEDAVFTDTIVDISGKLDAENPTSTGSFSLNRKENTLIGESSVAIGWKCQATGVQSFAEGYQNTASGKKSHAEGSASVASGYASHAEGYETEASGYASHAEGSYGIASGECSHAEGYENIAEGDYSHAEGMFTTASGAFSHAQGRKTTASNFGSFALGKNNSEMTAGASVSGSVGDVFVIGNGTGGNSTLIKSNAFRITYAGAVYGVGAFNTTGADYAEFIKPWFDDNPGGEDRVGYFVTIKDGKLYKAEPGDYIVGITSGNPSVVGNGDEDWLGRWQRDEFGRIVTEDAEEEIEKRDEETGEIVLEKTGKIIKNARFKANPDYDPTVKYIERKARPEWDYVGMIGVIALRDDGTCAAGGFAKCAAGGIATAADTWECHKTFFVIERVSDSVVKVEMR